MSGLFYNLGKKLGPKVRKAKWLWQSIAGTEADAIRVEHEVGRDLAREIKRQLELDPEPKAAHTIRQIGAKLEADNLGARLTAAAGYDPKAPAQLLSRLAKLARPANQSGLGSYFSSHPAFDLRIERVNRLLNR